VSDQTGIPRRAFIGGSLAVLVAGVLGWRWLPGRRGASPPVGAGSGEARATLLGFISALFGRELSAPDVEDLSQRLDQFASNEALRRDCETLVLHLDELAATQGASRFNACSPSQREQIVGQIMRIDPKTFRARLLSKFFAGQRDFYRMRWSAVPSLAWLYQHSAAAWRARGYTRWPGVPGDWHEIVAPGPPYP
jgi:hypothetical protein